MPSLNVELNYFGHPKTKALRRLLGKCAEILPLKVWVYTALYFPKDGRLTGISPAELEAECQWWGKTGAMVRAMVEVNFLEMDGKTMVIHDWLVHESHILNYQIRGRKGGEAKAAKAKAMAETESASSSASSTSIVASQTDRQTEHAEQTEQTDRGKQPSVAENGKRAKPLPLGVVGTPGDDDLDQEIRRYIDAHTMLTYHPKAHADLRKTVLSVGWTRAKAFVEGGVKNGKSFPCAYAAGCANNVEKSEAARPRARPAASVRPDN